MSATSKFVSFLVIGLFSIASNVYSQEKNQNIATSVSVNIGDDTNTKSNNSSATAETNFNFVSWFMGSKQTMKENVVKDVTNKKALINSGVSPNRILMKTFLKKAQSQGNAIA
jgi:hypothetical protein